MNNSTIILLITKTLKTQIGVEQSLLRKKNNSVQTPILSTVDYGDILCVFATATALKPLKAINQTI